MIHDTLRLISRPNRVIELALEYKHHTSAKSIHWDKLYTVLSRADLRAEARDMFEGYAHHLVMNGHLSLAQAQTLNGALYEGCKDQAFTVPCPWCNASAHSACFGSKQPIIKGYHDERFALFWVVAKWPPRFSALVAIDAVTFESDDVTVWTGDVPRDAHASQEFMAVGLRFKSMTKHVAPRQGRTARERCAFLRKAIMENDPEILLRAASNLDHNSST